MLETLFGNETTGLILLNLYHYGEIHARALSRNIDRTHRSIILQLNKLEEGGLLVSREVGRTRLYAFNTKSPFTKHVKEMLKITYDSMPINLKEKTFKERTRPRAKGKIVIESNK